MILGIGTSLVVDVPLIKQFETVVSKDKKTVLIICKN